MIINGKRSLAYIAKITQIEPIEGADRIVYATINDGWKVVVSKSDGFEVGQNVIYIEIDSRVPDIPQFEFLRDRKFKVKTIKLRGVYSQGLVVPVGLFPELKGKKLGEDVADDIGIIYHVPEDNERKADARKDPDAKFKSMCARHADLAKRGWWKWLMKHKWGRDLLFVFFGKKKDTPAGFPTKFPYVRKTDEERVENMPFVLGYKYPLTVTEKLDGTSCTYILERLKRGKFEFYICSRNRRILKEDQQTFHKTNIYWEMAEKYNIEARLTDYLKSHPECSYVCTQGEAVGNVQGNPLKLAENRLYVFNFITSYGPTPSIIGAHIVGTMGMEWVPILSTDFHMPSDMETFKVMADGMSAINPNVAREGLVLRDPNTTLSFKNVSRKYLEKHQEA